MSEATPAGAVAIVGMAGRFPGAPDVERFWENLRDGVESITHFDDDELERLGVARELREQPNFVRAGALVEGVEEFDHAFWGYSPREAALLDPQQRLFLETAWEALEHAGYDAQRYEGLIGVYAGMGLSTYLLFNLAGDPSLSEADTPTVMLGNDKDFLSTRTSYHLDLRGPSITVQSGCSTSLVAAHLACDGLLSYQCDIALAGGSTIAVPQRTGYLYAPGGTASPDGRCRAFDADAAGTLFGSGVGAVVLKRLDDALADRDTIHAVIRGSAVNNDGAAKVGFTAPSVEGQAEVVVRAQGVAGVGAATIGYVEAHGTATELGDPMEVAALTRAFRESTEAAGFCALGSVKTNVGHLDTAAGVASLIKATLALRHKQIPPSLHFTRPNPRISFDGSPFFVNTRLRDWAAGAEPRRAGVSAFGFGGTNAHVVLEEAPEPAPAPASAGPQLVVLSARTPGALERATERLAAHLGGSTGQSVADVAYTLQVGRAVFEYRRAVVCADREDAVAALRAPSSPRVRSRRQAGRDRPVAFMLAGLGDQYAGMARDLYERERPFREAVDRCAELLHPHLGTDLRAVMLPPDRDGADQPPALDFRAMVRGSAGGDRLHDTVLAHPAVFVLDYALAQQWAAWGVRPAAMIGHSLGEYVAATLAGVFTLDDALRFVATRATLIDRLPGGAMLAVPLPPAELEPLIPPTLALALANGPRLAVVSGPDAEIEAFERVLATRDLPCRRLQATHAFHSAMMRPVVGPLDALARTITLRPPEIPFVSNVTGTWITDAQATDPGYWSGHSALTVRFADGLRELAADREQVLLEVGPGQALSALAAEHLETEGRAGDAVVVPSMRASYDRRRSDGEVLLDALGQLWAGGASVDWRGVHAPVEPRRVGLPAYPFERERCWIAPAGQGRSQARPAERGRAAAHEWLSMPSWRAIPPPAPSRDGDLPAGHWLVLAGEGDRLAAALRERLLAAGRSVTVAEAGAGFARAGDGTYRMDPADPAHHAALVEALARDGHEARARAVTTIVHLWTLAAAPDAGVERHLALGFYSLAFLARALAAGGGPGRAELWVVSSGVAAVESADAAVPARAMLLGPAKCIPQEYERIGVHVVDVAPPGDEQVPGLLGRLLDVIAESPAEKLLAYRGERRWVQTYEPLALPDDRPAPYPLRERGVYVVVGGTGRVGLDLAEHLAGTVRARLALVGRTAFPAPEQWEGWLTTHGEGDATSGRIRRLQRIVERGGEVVVVRADVGDAEGMRAVRAQVEEQFGRIDGVLHAAGLAGPPAFALLDELDRERCEAQFRAKVLGCQALEEVFADAAPDFFLLVSSNAALLGGLGLTAYTAGNIFLDTFAQQRRGPGARWLSLNLEEWLPDDADDVVHRTSLTQYGVKASEIVVSVQRVIERSPVGRTTLVTADLEQRLDRWIREPVAARQAGRAEPGARSPRPALDTPYVAPRDDSERAVAEIWQDLLGIAEVGRDDNFYALGGHSLLATQIVARVRAAFDADLEILSLFAEPTVAGLAERARHAERADDALGLRPVPRGGALPLSYAQRRFWFLDQLAPGNPFYNVPDVVRISGPLRIDVLRASINDVVARHEALRTTFAPGDGDPVQVVHPALDLDVGLVDLRDVREADRDDRLRELAVAEARGPFDLERGPLVRVTAVRTADEEFALLVTMHHSVSDAWSIGLFIRELSALYDARSRGAASPLPPLEVQYADFSLWQHERLDGALLGTLLDYWKRQLAGAPAVLELPADHHPRPAVQSFAGAAHPVELDAGLVARLRRIAADEGCTLFMTLLAAFMCLLHRYTGAGDLVVGSPIAGRTRPELEDLIGTFVNMLPLRAQVEPGATFVEVLHRVRAVTLEAYQHQDLPFELLVEALRPERNLHHNPVFQVVFALQNAPLPDMALGDLRIEPVAMPSTTAKFDLMLMLRETGDGATGMIEYATDLYSGERIARMATHLVTLLSGIADEPDRPVADLPMIPPAERDLLLSRWAHGASLDVPAASIPELIGAQAAMRPDALALLDGITFGELDRRSNRIARCLRSLGVTSESRVGVSLERSAGTVVALLGVMKAGGAYVPLDPAYPAQRWAFMIADSQVELVLAERGSAADGARVLEIEDLLARSAGHDDSPLPWTVGAQDAAYVIYTSGSTGEPKGVVGLHGGMVNRLAWMWERFPFAPGERGCQKTSLNFLDSFWEIFGPLCQGVGVVVVPDAAVEDPPELVRALARGEVTRIVLVPSLLRALLDSGIDLAGALPALRLWVTSGEALAAELAGRFAAALPDRRLLNLYGASEVSADVTYHVVEPADVERGAVPIGRPVANTSVYVLDRDLRPVPVGVEGDLYVAGRALGRGYLGRPELTAESFVPDPFAAGAGGGRLYRTGDRARFRDGGTLEYLGRRDSQVKVRGFRVELAETERFLGLHPSVAECSVAAQRDTLVAYCVAEPGQRIDGEAIRAFLRDRLPGYMVPNLYVGLAALPRTPSGKLDRTRLAGHAVPEPGARAPLAPRDPVESAVAELWLTVLERPAGALGVSDNFFAVGGHSLLATKLLARAREVFGVAVALRRFFEDPTVAGLAGALLGEPGRRAEVERRAALLLEVTALADDEVERMLGLDEGAGRDG
jgi:amino acid adenylation domain-containing protein